MGKSNFLNDAILDDFEMLEIHGGTSDNITCGSNCGHNCGNNCGDDCGNSCGGLSGDSEILLPTDKA